MSKVLKLFSSDLDSYDSHESSDMIGGGINNNDNLELDGGGVIRKYRKRCLEHKKKIDEIIKENKSLKKRIKELEDKYE